MAEKKTTTKTTAARKTTARKSESAEPKGAAVAKAPAAERKAAAAGGTRKRVTRAAAPAAATKTVAPAAIRKTISKRTTVRRKAAAPATTASTAPTTRRRTKVGMVVSAKSQKTVIVEVERMRQHPLYRKALRVGTRYAAHTENGEVLAGDLVRIQESRPYSATKRWRVLEVLSRAGEAGAAAPRVTDVEKQLEEQEGVTELLTVTKPESAEETPQAGDVPPEGDTETKPQ